ncbi:MAG: hypothetical protein E7317_01280 [Clostridiales bacterium]|nr:hypothetical protein [Clostridiales bacterium]
MLRSKSFVSLMIMLAMLMLPQVSLGEVFVSDEEVTYTENTQQQVDLLNQNSTLQLNVAGSISLIQGDTYELTATQISEADAVNMTWDSTDANVAFAQPSQRDPRSAVLTAVGPGVAIINVRTVGGLATSLSVTVAQAVKPDKIFLNYDEQQTVNVGDSLQLQVTMEPSTARAQLKWTSKSSKIATVDDNGLVTAVKEGTTTITVRTNNKKSARLKIKVVDPYKPTDVGVNPAELTVNIGDTAVITPVLAPIQARTTYKWTSSSSKVAKVNENGVVTGVRTGTCTITVRTANKKSAKCKVKVVDNKQPSGVRFDTEAVVMQKGVKAQLKALLTPDTARTNLTWKSSKSKVVKVDSDGVISCLRAGTATITARTTNKLTASIDITVVDDIEQADTSINGWIWPVHATVTVDNAIFMDDMYIATGDSILFRWDVDGSVSGYYVYLDQGEGDTAQTVFTAENVLENELQIKRSDLVPGQEYRLDLGVTPLAGDSIDMSWTNIRFMFSDNSVTAPVMQDAAPAAPTVVPTATPEPLPEDGVSAVTPEPVPQQQPSAQTAGEEGLVFDDDLIW